MEFHGLFIGIDRYQSPLVNWLACARRDAEALEALFADTLGGRTTLLVDEEATRAEIEKQFSLLAHCSLDDVVVIAFSGHGTPTHELVTYDANPTDLGSTAIPLDLLTEWFARIPARHLVCVLDCCFSGGAGSKILEVDNRARDIRSTAQVLQEMSGEGRFILTASSPTEPAYENQKLQHGFLTFYLLEALMGAEEVRQGGTVPVYRLLEYVSERVEAAAAQVGRPQHPTFRGRLDGELKWPVFKPGSRFVAIYPERGRAPATGDLQSLASYGLPADLIHAWSQAIPSLNELQIDAINECGVLDGTHILVSAPTSSGKTMIGELAALRGVLQRQRSFFLMPLRALVNDKHEEFLRTYSAFGIRTIRATGEISDDIGALMRGQYDICLMTYEKFTALAVGAPHILDQVGTVVVDEVQMIADPTRGVNLEFLMTLLRMRRRQGIEPQIVALSAVIGEANGFDLWLGARLLRRNQRPVPLDEGLLRGDGSYRYIESEASADTTISPYVQRQWGKGTSQDWVIPLVAKLVGEGKQVIVFRETRGEARGCALYLARALGLPPSNSALDALPRGDPSLASTALREALEGGVAFHISDLDRDERTVIEQQFRAPDSSIRVIAATTTLAMGVNTPAEAVVIVGLEHPGPTPYSLAEYKNIVGRAGRLGFATRGYSYLLALSPNAEHQYWNRYVLGAPEDISSEFLKDSSDPRSLVVRVLASLESLVNGSGVPFEDVIDFLESSFGVFQRRREQDGWNWDRPRLTASLEQLVKHDLVVIDGGGACLLTELGRLAGEGGVEIESMLRLVAALRPVAAASMSDQTLIAATQLTVELDQVWFPLNRKSTQKEPRTWQMELGRQGVPASVLQSLFGNVDGLIQATSRAKRAVACLLWMSDMQLVQVEKILTQFGGALDGAAGAVRGTASRTCDLLPTVGRVAELLHPELDLGTRVNRILTRLEIGVPSGAVELASELGRRISRADYLALLSRELCSVEQLLAAEDDVLMPCVGNDERKLREVRAACVRIRDRERSNPTVPEVPRYEP